MKFIILVDPSLVIITTYTWFVWSMPWCREEDFLRNTAILHFLPTNYLPFGWGSWNLQFLVFLPYRCYIQNLVKIGPVVLEKKMLNHEARRTTDDQGRQPIAEWQLQWGYVRVLWAVRFMRNLYFSQIGLCGSHLKAGNTYHPEFNSRPTHLFRRPVVDLCPDVDELPWHIAAPF